jgi:hypothetical protein
MYLVYSNTTGKLIDQTRDINVLNKYSPLDVTVYIVHI